MEGIRDRKETEKSGASVKKKREKGASVRNPSGKKTTPVTRDPAGKGTVPEPLSKCFEEKKRTKT